MSKSLSYSKYRSENTLEKRRTESGRIRLKYPDRVPVICEVAKGNEWAITLDRHKYLVPYDLTTGQFLNVIRKRIRLGAEQGLFIFTDRNTLPACSELMSVMYNQYKNEDGFLYFTVAVENTFG